jgi:hypothetical protein
MFFADLRLDELMNDQASEVLDQPSDLKSLETISHDEEEIDETTRDNVQSMVVELWKTDQDGEIERCSRGFLLDENLLVAGSLPEEATILRRGEELVADLPLDDHEAVDLHLYTVGRTDTSSDWEMVMAEITPPNVGEILAVATENDWVEFEFRTVREIDLPWGTVLQLPTLSSEMDGAPIVNEYGRLVGITRVRSIGGKLESFGLPVRWLFDLARGTLTSKLAYLREWEAWGSENWDEVSRMTNSELASTLRIEELEAELAAAREQMKLNGTKEGALPRLQKVWLLLRRLVGGIRN